MIRTTLFLSVFVTACTVGEVGGPNTGDDGVKMPDAGNTVQCVNRVAPPSPAHIHANGNTTNAGLSCITGGCHGTPLGNGAPQFTFAGTLYGLDGVTPQAGATVRVYPNGSTNPLTMVTDDAGNFSTGANPPNPFPAATDVTACPGTQGMTGKLNVANDGSCSGGVACHGGGSTTGTIKLQ
jgi:hypothetical protein